MQTVMRAVRWHKGANTLQLEAFQHLESVPQGGVTTDSGGNDEQIAGGEPYDPGPFGEEVGHACNTFDDCPPGGLEGPICLSGQYEDGYCSAACIVDEDCPGDGVCVGRYCMAPCENDDDCRSKYRCRDEFSEGPPVCIPSSSDLSSTGEACSTDSSCQGSILNQICAPHSSDLNYCTGSCIIDADCPSDSLCSIGNDTIGYCVKACESSMECNSGFACYDFIELLTRRNGSTVRMSRAACYPIGEGEQRIGEPCTGRGDCEGGRRALCIYQDDQPTCSTLCNRDNACPAGTRCAFENPDSSEGYCLETCRTDNDCSEGLLCQDADGTGQTICAIGGVGNKKSGTVCERVSECSGGSDAQCVPINGTNERICTRRCSFKNECPRGEHCSLLNDLETGVCLPNCESGQAGECADGQACFDIDADGEPECFPAPFASFNVDLGGPCTMRDQCRPGLYCYGGGISGVVGLCSRSCRTSVDCGDGGHCALVNRETNEGTCVQTCDNTADCGDGLICDDAYDGDGIRECATTSQGIGRVGDPCLDMGWCNGGHRARCVRSAGWTTRGYCVVDGCTAEAGCPSGSHCGYINPTTNRGVCLADCGAGMRCDFDLTCADLDGDETMECVPQTSGTSNIGSGCTSARDCETSVCLDEGNPRGMCSERCQLNTDCPAGTHCELYAEDTGICLPNCEEDDDCRAGYVCANLYTTAAKTCVGLGDGDNEVGEPCRSSTDCARGMRASCLSDGRGWENGYCLKNECDADTGCDEGSHCGFFSRFSANGGYCVRTCQNDADCPRQSYECYDFDGDGQPECAPRRAQAAGDRDCAQLDRCIADCNQYDAGCRDTCYSAANPEAVIQWFDMVTCQNTANCDADDNLCRIEGCTNERTACYGIAAVPRGNASCLILETCIRRCEQDDALCPARCIADATPEAYNAYSTVMECRAFRAVSGCMAEITLCTGVF